MQLRLSDLTNYMLLSISDEPNMGNKELDVISFTSSSVQLQVEQLTLNKAMTPYYFYVIQYKEAGMSFSDGPTMPHKDASKWVVATIDGLRSATEYDIQVMPFRKDILNNITQAGQPTAKLSLITGTCICYHCVNLSYIDLCLYMITIPTESCGPVDTY